MKYLKLFGLFFSALLFTMCGSNKGNQVAQDDSSSNKFDVIEVVQANQYTYIQVLEGSEIKWMAVTRQEISKGETYFYDSALPMNNFHSKELDRTFEVIYFVNTISKTAASQGVVPGGGAMHSGKAGAEMHTEIQITKAEGEITIAQIFENPEAFSGKEIEIRGVVVKINEGIMGTNWIHLQDGTTGNGKFDLTITCDDLPQLNQEAGFKGIITLNKDFGAGYVYDVIMEHALHTDKWNSGPAAQIQ
jgi:hypothetical protein